MSLRPYQREAVEAVGQSWRDGYKRTLLVMATGTGKTFTASTIVREREAAGRILWLAHREELIDQAAETLAQRSGLTTNIEKAEHRAPRDPGLWGAEPVVVASVPSMRNSRLASWPADAFATIVVDEAHHAPAVTYRKILDHFPGALTLGLTATPDRGDRVGLWNVFDHVAYEYAIRQGIAEGYLCDVLQKQVTCADLDLSDIRTVAGDLNQGQLEAAMIDGGVLHQVAGPLAREAGNRQTIVFTAGVAQAHALADILAGYVDGARIEALDGNTPRETRRQMIADFRGGRIQFLINCAVLTEGFDAPETACIAVARPTKSRSLYSQMIGRGTRVAESKSDCLVLDFVGNSGRHKLVNPLDVLGGKELPDEIAREAARLTAAGIPTAQALDEAEQLAVERAREDAERRARAKKVRARVSYRTRKIDPFGCLDGDDGPRAEQVQLERLRGWGVDVDAHNFGKREAGKMESNLIRRRRAGLATYKQARVLQRFGFSVDLSKGEASRIISAIAKNGWRVPESIRGAA